jgi:tetratricopeptide (TPR) repeat protein
MFSIAVCRPALAQRPSGASKDSKPVETHFEAAETYQLAGVLDKAAAEYRQGISDALDRLGNLKIADGNYEAGLDLLRGATSADPKNVNAAVDLGIAYFRTGNYDKARDCLKGVLRDDPSNFRARNLSGKIDFMQGNFEAAVADLQAALAVNQDLDVAYSLALANLELKKLPQATVLFDEMRSSLGQTAELHVLLGQAYRLTGFLDLAVTEFQGALTMNAHYPNVHRYLGMTYFALAGESNYKLAAEQLRMELAAAPRDYSSHYFLGLIALERHNLVEAEASLQEAHRIRPDDSAPLLLLGRLYNDQKRWPEAITALRRAIALASSAELSGSQVTVAHVMLATAYSGAGQASEAASEAALARARQPSSGDAPSPSVSQTPLLSSVGGSAQDFRAMLLESGHKPQQTDPLEAKYVAGVSKLLGNAYHNLGVIDARAGNYAGAAVDFKDAARWDTSIAHLDQNWALAAFRAQAYQDAIPPLERLVHASPADQNVREMLGVSYYMINDFKESAATFRPIVNSLPDNPGLLLPAGIAFVKTGDVATGQRLFARALASGNASPEVHLMLGQAYAEQSDTTQALAEFQRALSLNPKLPEAHYFSGMVLFKRGEIDQAAQQFQAELDLNPTYTPAMYQLAYVRLQQHQAPEATRLLSAVIGQEPANSDAHYQLGKAMLEQNDVGGAIRELQRSVELHPTDYAYFQLSRAYTRAGRTKDASEAQQNYEKLKPKPNTPPVADK